MTQRVALGFCLILSVAFFADALVGSRTVTPTGYLAQSEPWESEGTGIGVDPAQQYDQVHQFYPWAQYYRESVHSGVFPLWNPFNYLGTPFFANPQTAMLFPLTWLHLVLPLTVSFTLIFVLKLALALTGMNLLLRDRGLGVEASLLGSVLFGLSMHTVVSLPFPYSNVTVVFPWLLLAVRRLLREPTRLSFAGVVLSVMLIILAGQPQSALVAFLAAGLFAGFEMEWRPRWRRLILLGIGFSIAGMISAVQWLPSVEYVGESMIPVGPRIIKSGFAYNPSCFLNFLVPDFFGSHLKGNFWGFPGYHDIAFYSSALMVLLVPLTYWGADGRRFLRGPAFAATTSVVCVGILTGLQPFEFLLDVPGFDLMRRNKFVFLLVFCLAELSARGADAWARGRASRKGRRTGVLAFALVGFAGGLGYWFFRDSLRQLDPEGLALAGAWQSAIVLLLAGAALTFLPRKWALTTIIAVAVADLAIVSYPLNPRGTQGSPFPPSPVAERLREREQRIGSLDGSFPPNTALVYGIQDYRGYDVMTPRRLFRFMQQIDPDLGNAYRGWARLDPEKIHPQLLMREVVGKALERHGDVLKSYLENDSYWTVEANKVSRPDLFRLLQIGTLVQRTAARVPEYLTPSRPSEGSGVQLFVDPTARRYRLYNDWTDVDESEALETMASLDLDRRVVIEAVSAIPLPAGTSAIQDEVLELSRSAHRSHYSVSTRGGSILVEFERLSPGWSVYVDGEQESEAFPAFYIFRGAYVPPGDHEVEFRYEPPSFDYGRILSVFGILFGGSFLVFIFRD